MNSCNILVLETFADQNTICDCDCSESSFSFIEGVPSNVTLSLIQLEWVKSYRVTVVSRIIIKY